MYYDYIAFIMILVGVIFTLIFEHKKDKQWYHYISLTLLYCITMGSMVYLVVS